MRDQPQRIKRSEAIARAGGLDALADWLRANNYNPVPVNLLFPDVPLEDEGVYYNAIDWAAIVAAIYIGRRENWPAILAGDLPREMRELPSEECARLLNEHLPAVLAAWGDDGPGEAGHYEWRLGSDTIWRPLPREPFVDHAAAVVGAYLAKWDSPLLLSDVQRLWSAAALLPDDGRGVRLPGSVGGYAYDRPEGWRANDLWTPLWTEACARAIRDANWVDSPDYGHGYIQPRPPRPLTYAELDAIALYLADLSHWSKSGPWHDAPSFISIPALMAAAGIADLTEPQFQRVLKPYVRAFQPELKESTFSRTLEDGTTVRDSGFKANLVIDPEEVSPGRTIPGYVGRSDRIAWTHWLAHGTTLLVAALADSPMRVQSAWGALRGALIPARGGTVSPFGYTYLPEATLKRGAVGSKRTLQILAPAADPEKLNQDQDALLILDQRTGHPDGSQTITSQEPAAFIRNWLTTPLPDVVDVFDLVLEMARDGRYTFLFGFNASGRYLTNRDRWAMAISRRTREHFTALREAEAEQEAIAAVAEQIVIYDDEAEYDAPEPVPA
jgi:hypothetical protein